MSSDGQLLYAALSATLKDEAASSAANSKQKRTNLKRAVGAQSTSLNAQRKRRRRQRDANDEPIFIGKRRESSVKSAIDRRRAKPTGDTRTKLTEKQMDKIEERNATMKDTYAKIIGSLDAKHADEREAIQEYDKARTSRSWNHLIGGKYTFYKDKEEGEASVFSEADFKDWKTNYDARAQIKRKI